MKHKRFLILGICIIIPVCLLTAAYFGIRSSFSANRENGAHLRASAFEAEYAPVEHTLEKGFMTTVDKNSSAGCHIFFLHGGGCVMDAAAYHTDVICALADRGLRITAYDYPLFPETDYVDICEAVYEAYTELTALYPEDEIVLYGDSAGGALALHLLMRLRDEGAINRPAKSILVSPMLDLSMSNPDIRQYVEGDSSLNYTGCKILAFYMAGLGKAKSPDHSPIYGDLNDLGQLLMFYGSREILRPDCERLVEMLSTAEGSYIEAHTGEEKLHDYVMIVEDPQSVLAFDRMAEFLKPEANTQPNTAEKPIL